MARTLHCIAFWANRHRIDWLAALIYRVVCPYPIGTDTTVRSCNKAGRCGCDNWRGR